MKLLSCTIRPLSAMIFLAACGGRDTTDLVNGTTVPGTAVPGAAVPGAATLAPATSNPPAPAAGSLAAGAERAAVSSAVSEGVDAAPEGPVDAADDAAPSETGAGEAGAGDAAAADSGGPDAGTSGADGGAVVVPLGACLSCAEARCPAQFGSAVGSASSASNLALVTQLFDCVIGGDWELGNSIPQSSCFFADPAQPLGSLLPCYCGSTPVPQCLATGPVTAGEGCGSQVQVASQCDPIVASCVTSSGSNPEVALGDALQLLNCERAACPAECGFPPPIEE